MLNTININLKTDIKADRPTSLPITLMSQDKNNNQFILRFTNGGESVTLDDTYSVEILTKFTNSGTSRLTAARVRQDYATWEFDTAYITQDETVYNYVYVRKSGSLVVSADSNLSEKENESEWPVVVTSHVPPTQELQLIGRGIPTNGGVAKDIVKAFKDGTRYTSTGGSGDFAYNVDVDFTTQGESDLVGWWYGHVHHDRLINVEGINFVATLNSRGDKVGDSGLPDGATAPARVLGTDSEDAWDIVTINKDTRSVDIVRYGAGDDREFTF